MHGMRGCMWRKHVGAAGLLVITAVMVIVDRKRDGNTEV